MLEAMQERQVSIGTVIHSLPRPFFVLATQNPLEQEGTYPLPEAQLDRFLLYVKVDYPTGREEWDIARRVTSQKTEAIQAVLSADEIVGSQDLVHRLPIADQVVGYCCALVRSSRPGRDEAPDFVNKWVNFGAGPRGILTLISCAKARAVLHGRYHATIEDVQAVAQARPATPYRPQLRRTGRRGQQRTPRRNADREHRDRRDVRDSRRVTTQKRKPMERLPGTGN